MRFVIVLAALFAFQASAKEIVFINAGSSTGGQAVYAKEITNQMVKDGFVVDQKTTNVNCALAKTIWDSSERAMFITATNNEGTTQRPNQACFIETNKTNFLYWLNTGVVSFCSAKDKTWDDFRKPGSVNTVVVMADPVQEQFIQNLGEAYNNKTRTVRIHSYNDAVMMAKSGDADFVFRVSIHETPEFKGKCFWNHTEIHSKAAPDGFSFPGHEKFGEQMFIMHKGLTQTEVNAARISIRQSVREGEEIRKQIQRRGQIVLDWNSMEEFHKIEAKFFEGY